MFHIISLSLAMAALWMLLSGFFTPLLLGLGVASVALTVYIAHRMDVIDHEGHPIHLGPRAILYFPWLAWEIVKSSWDVAKTILGFGDPIAPSVFKTKASQKSDVGVVLYANSITLTPGTVTIGVRGSDDLEIHALTAASRAGVESGDMDRRCSTLENMHASETEDDT